jgi:hypothetical protein
LIQAVADDLRAILRSELRLAAREMKDNAGEAGKAGAMLGGGGVLALCGGAFLLFLGYRALARATGRPLLSAFLMGAGLEATAFAMALGGAHKFKTVDLAPKQAIEGLKDTVREPAP